MNKSAPLVWISVALFLQIACSRGTEPARYQSPPSAPGPLGAAESREREAGIVRFSDSQMREFGITTSKAESGTIRIEATLPGEVLLNSDRTAHVVPRVSGVVREVRKNLGETVRQGEVLAVLESRELADSTAAVMTARQRLELAETNFAREEQVWKKRISPEQDYLEAKTKLAEARIELQTAQQKLQALGFPDDYVEQLQAGTREPTNIYQMTAPFAGTVMEKHISLGEVVKDETAAFMIADLSTVWVNLDVQQKNLQLVRVGQTVQLGIENESPTIPGRISFVSPTATETNRTIHARVVLPNPAGKLRPGLFVNGRVLLDSVRVPVLVPNESLVMLDGAIGIFVGQKDGFRFRPVVTGRSDGSRTEITHGLEPGQTFVSAGAFTVKSELQKPEAEE